MRPLACLALTAPLVAGPAPAADLAPVRAYLEGHCVRCHGPHVQKARLRLDTLKPDPADPGAFVTWVKVHDRVAAGEMPPKRKPPADQTKASLKALSDALSAADRRRQAAEGRTALRRLTRAEYENTLRDLLGLPGLPVKNLLPPDGRAHGFDKAGDALDLSAVHLAKYMEAADFALDRAIARWPDRPKVYKVRDRFFAGPATWFNDAMVPLRNKKADPAHVKKVKESYDERPKLVAKDDSFGILTCPRPAFEPQLFFGAVESGFYRLRLSVWAFHWKRAKVLPARRHESVSLTAGGRLLAYADAPPDESKVTEVLAWVNGGERVDFAAANLWPHFADPLTYEGPGVGLDWYEVEGPIHDVWPPRSHKRLFGDLPIVRLPKEGKSPVPGAPPRRNYLLDSDAHWRYGWKPDLEHPIPLATVVSKDPPADARSLLADFLPRAFRRPVAPAEVARYVQVATRRLKAGACFEDAMRAAYKRALCSPDFLFLREKPGPLDDHALACRLSYFLWGSMPDDRLRAAADAGRLRTRREILRQVDRMLADPKSERFVADFLDQWLDLRDINATAPDAQLYPEFRPDLRDAMLIESRAFFRELLDRDLGAAHLVHSDFAMLNQRLAEYYGVPGVVGSKVRRVKLPPCTHRGGVLTQAAVLKVTANGTTTSPVKRGAWVIDRLLGRPPAPPPPDIPAVDPDVRGTTTIRDQLARHRSSPVCAACHARFDPPGFALESFDVLGGWRTRYRSTGKGGEPPDPKQFYGAPPGRLSTFRHGPRVDPSGTLPSGEKFADVDEFRKLLLRDPRALADNLARRLLVYSTGAPVGFADRQVVDEIVRRARRKDYGVRTLLVEVVTSPAFRNK
jgi:mono/diheme cytochrome c family protein